MIYKGFCILHVIAGGKRVGFAAYRGGLQVSEVYENIEALKVFIDGYKG
ncbi:MAG: hypothetical protein ACI35O_12880 [Bacillaceae bacterium]